MSFRDLKITCDLRALTQSVPIGTVFCFYRTHPKFSVEVAKISDTEYYERDIFSGTDVVCSIQVMNSFLIYNVEFFNETVPESDTQYTNDIKTLILSLPIGGTFWYKNSSIGEIGDGNQLVRANEEEFVTWGIGEVVSITKFTISSVVSQSTWEYTLPSDEPTKQPNQCTCDFYKVLLAHGCMCGHIKRYNNV